MAIIVFMFTTWLLEQQDRPDSVGMLARTAYKDHNDGCAILYKDAIGWLHHFQGRHRNNLAILIGMLGDAHVEYCTQLDTKTDEFY